MLIVAESRKIGIKEIPVVWKDDSNSKVKIFSLSCIYLEEIFKLLFRKVRRRL